MQKYKVSEMFLSLQGEGLYTGRNTAWVRLFNCNLTCDGFFQKDPTDKSTYELPYQDVDINKIHMVEDLPVFEYGCDSSYSWSKKYRHLIPEYTQEEIADKLETLVNGKFVETICNFNKNTHLCFTGGEPLLKPNQKIIIAILNELLKRNNLPKYVTFETNTTTQLTDDFKDAIKEYSVNHGIEFHVSCSPKLFNVTGELNKKAWKHDVAEEYRQVMQKQSFKFVVNDKDATWVELDDYISKLKTKTDNIYIMPVGATVEQQSSDTIAKIANKALQKGYHVSGRMHCYIFGNGMGT